MLSFWVVFGATSGTGSIWVSTARVTPVTAEGRSKRTQRRTTSASIRLEPALKRTFQPRAVGRGTKSMSSRPELAAALRATARGGHFRWVEPL